MSADDGWLLRKNTKGKFVLQHYFASADHLPDVDSEHALQYDTLEEAMADYEKRESQSMYHSEYGLTVKLSGEARETFTPHVHYVDDPDTCTEMCKT